MTARHAAATRPRAVRHARNPHRHHLLRLGALLVVGVMSFGVTGAATAYVRLQNNILSADIDHLLGDDRPEVLATPDPDDPNSGAPVNILVLGTDSREGSEEAVADGEEGQRSDTTIVVHVSADRQRVDLVSIPRDSLVQIPECLRSDGTSSRAQGTAMFNSAYSIGGMSGEISDAAACTQRTVEQNTGVRIDHFVVINMAGFINMVDALGGVPICIPEEIYSPKANNLHLQAGNQVLDGGQALSYARARSGEGLDGSDTARIGRQQRLLAATASSVLSKNLLTDVPELVRFLNAVTRSLTVSSGLSSIPDMTGLAFSLREVSSGSITFMTVPFAPAPSDPNRVVWTSEADDVWAKVASDQPLVTPVEPPTAEDPTTDTGTGTDGAGSTEDVSTDAPVTDPEQVETKEPGVDPFTPDDTAVCG
ncbi:LCP family protein [Actinotalea sp. K2]|uniref:LCP family protein n=1 Tax=Actinotalea sp. K2 TaxID=2939438 RepID=UPI002016DEE6|nr:LCP family protein [Actinotalea sp. K2]MCL3862734.1 LCP family protein [Actinotalea sp. K2]